MRVFLILLTLLGSSTSSAVTVVNGSLTGPNDTYSLMPSGWVTLFPGRSEADNPDTEGADGPHEAYNLSPDGGTFVAAAHATTQGMGKEGLQQTLFGLEPGTSYRLDFYQSNLGIHADNLVVSQFEPFPVWDWNAYAAWELYLDGVATGLYSQVLAPETGPLPNNTWFPAHIIFTASSSVHAIGFAPQVMLGDNTFLGIDGIRISVVPIPAGIWLFCTALLSLLPAYRKQALIVSD